MSIPKPAALSEVQLSGNEVPSSKGTHFTVRGPVTVWTSAHFPPPELSPLASPPPTLTLPISACAVKQHKLKHLRIQVDDDDDDTPFTQPPSPHSCTSSSECMTYDIDGSRSPSLQSGDWELSSAKSARIVRTSGGSDVTSFRSLSPSVLSSAVVPQSHILDSQHHAFSSSLDPSLSMVDQTCDQQHSAHFPHRPAGPITKAVPERYRCWDDALDNFRLPPAASNAIPWHSAALSPADDSDSEQEDDECQFQMDSPKVQGGVPSDLELNDQLPSTSLNPLTRVTWFHINCHHQVDKRCAQCAPSNLEFSVL